MCYTENLTTQIKILAYPLSKCEFSQRYQLCPYPECGEPYTPHELDLVATAFLNSCFGKPEQGRLKINTKHMSSPLICCCGAVITTMPFITTKRLPKTAQTALATHLLDPTACSTVNKYLIVEQIRKKMDNVVSSELKKLKQDWTPERLFREINEMKVGIKRKLPWLSGNETEEDGDQTHEPMILTGGHVL